MMAVMTLRCGTEVLVDDNMLAELSRFKWRVTQAGRVYRKTTINGKTGIFLQLHRVVMGAEEGEIIDHIDGNPLNNQKTNLRFATKQTNTWNRRKGVGETSQFKGVCKRARSNRWAASIRIPGQNKCKHLGTFDCEHEAAHAYNKAAIEFHGEFAALNPVGYGKAKRMTTEQLCAWLRENSSGSYRPSADAADLIEELQAKLAAPVSTPQQSAQRASVDTPTDEQISAIYRSTFPRGPYLVTPDVHKFARAILAWGSAGSGAIPEGEAEYELYEVSGDDVLMVAGTSGKRAYEEILHYAAQYAQDGPIEIHKLVRTKLSVPVAAPSPAPQGEQA